MFSQEDIRELLGDGFGIGSQIHAENDARLRMRRIEEMANRVCQLFVKDRKHDRQWWVCVLRKAVSQLAKFTDEDQKRVQCRRARVPAGFQIPDPIRQVPVENAGTDHEASTRVRLSEMVATTGLDGGIPRHQKTD